MPSSAKLTASSASWNKSQVMADTEHRPDSEFPEKSESETPESAALPERQAGSDLDSPVLSAHQLYEEEAGESTVDPAESEGAARAVPVAMFDYEYNIMSDKPRLVQILAGAIDEEARRIKAHNPTFNRGSFNWPVEVAFKMALDRYYARRDLMECRKELMECRKEMESLAAKVENGAEKLAGLIEAELDVF